MAKRKREAVAGSETKVPVKKAKATTRTSQPLPSAPKLSDHTPVTIQIVAGSYDRVLHGITATVKPSPARSAPKGKRQKDGTTTTPQEDVGAAEFADTFLFNAHNSAIRCLALSPPSAPSPGQTQKVLLATGSTDERINLYNLSAHPPSDGSNKPGADAEDARLLSALAPRPILENPKNRELGTLLHHNSNITRLAFPNRSKLLSASEDSSVAVTRTRDWALLHTFKCPVPKPQGRPSGDTAAAGTAPAGVNDFAVHPSNKIMITVSKGERCMRLWNLETGKKSRVLNFERAALGEIGEGRHSTGEARRIVWGEEEFAVGFDRDVLVFGMDCRVRCRVMRDTRTKVHEFRYVETGGGEDESVLAVSTEDGRVLFFDTGPEGLEQPVEEKTLPVAKLVAQLGGKEAGVSGRIKDFTVLPVEGEDGEKVFFIVTASSDGRIRLWQLSADDLGGKGGRTRQVGKLLGTYGTQNRITCVGAFVMIPRPEGAEESEYEFDDSEEDDDEDDSDGE
ncbi:Protein MAK11 [Madurella mycetomatis]|uniref:Protein MAK11 n=1 Tax=Madurella mycetomatis TaxID=100816 RepID=A0A175W8M1_9PEZI|nr:Protein MAK11 [Madurella mycetomatis]